MYGWMLRRWCHGLWCQRFKKIHQGPRLVLDMGNPWVNFRLSLPIPVCTHTHEAWVWVLTGLPLGTDMGTVPMGVGTDLSTYYTIHIYLIYLTPAQMTLLALFGPVLIIFTLRATCLVV